MASDGSAPTGNGAEAAGGAISEDRASLTRVSKRLTLSHDRELPKPRFAALLGARRFPTAPSGFPAAAVDDPGPSGCRDRTESDERPGAAIPSPGREHERPLRGDCLGELADHLRLVWRGRDRRG